MFEIGTPQGVGRTHVQPVDDPVAALVLGHGAGGGIGAPDLIAASESARSAGLTVALVEQPYRVAGRRSQPPAAQLDEAWITIVGHLAGSELTGLPLVVGGRSAGARVACRTWAQTNAVAVLCLAFPLHPPGRADDPTKSRLPELDSVRVPTLVVQGERDPFGMPPGGRQREVVVVPGNHSLHSTGQVGEAVGRWLRDRFVRRATARR
jgi:predicted alpha/beta-hydrolase family hydrolase